jgi:Gpi18-like mannosyltransferase
MCTPRLNTRLLKYLINLAVTAYYRAMKYHKLLRYFAIVFFILVFRYFFSILVNYTLPYSEWVDGKFVFKESKSIRDYLPSYDFPALWGRWDTVSYVGIAKDGYDPGPFVAFSYKNWAFFPLYPLLVRGVALVLSVFTGGVAGVSLYLAAGLIVSNLCFVFALYYLDELADLLGFSKMQKILTVVLLLTFPAGYFYSLIYGESLFLLLSCLFLYFLFNNRIKLSALALGLLLVTRSNGLTFLPVFFIWFLVFTKNRTSIKDLVTSILLISAPIALFLFYMDALTGDFFAPIKIQEAWNNYYMLFGVFITYIKIYGITIKYEFILSILMLLGILGFLIFIAVKLKSIVLDKKKVAFILFAHVAVVFLLVSGVTNISSLFRYMSACVSLFILAPMFLDVKKYQVLYGFLIITGIFLQSLFFVYFLTNSHVYGF